MQFYQSLLPFLVSLFLKSTIPNFSNIREHKNYSSLNQIFDQTITQNRTMGISINVYRLNSAEKFDEISDLESQIDKRADTKVDLYKITSDLALIFTNSTNPYIDINSIPYKMLFGNHVKREISIGQVGGFLPTSEIPLITKWIKSNRIETYGGFSAMYDSLSNSVKNELAEMGSEDKVVLFNSYVRPLVVLYFTALENSNSVVFVGQ